MGARQSKRSVDITTTPKKEGVPSEGAVGDAATPGDGKLERIEESDAKPTTNGIAYRTDVNEDKDKDKDDTNEKDKEKEKEKQQSEEAKPEDTKQESSGESPAEGAEVTTPTEGNAASPNTVASPESKEPKKKEKMRKKWSLRSISFSKKDKSKPAREEAPKNGDVTKEEPLPESGEDCDQGAVSGSPAEENKSEASSPSENNSSTPLSPAVEANEESTTATTTTATTTTTAAPAAAPADATTPEQSTEAPTAVAAAAAATTTPPATSPVVEEKKEEPTPSAPTPVPLEDKKGDVENVEGEKKVVESAPEVEIPVVEKAVTHEVATTENNIEEAAPKVAPPAIPIEVPASPPSAPAITEDVASVTKAIEEIEISDKAVAAAVNEAIECNTNEIIADAHHQNNMNE
ncbi:PREDICTED: uncharacterized protein DDB_G0286299-like [Polistes dominula]|uniref:Uncharacterized protein DDB_G0286299-like n=1 Tax=Polistes dominula TaxID=743375 RepID=A0ABM1IWX9_POLDO|nr:PREDICTED: uncharacterized protein DDB_G0286299-like [Polistes dominula]XP_015184717.1 PREDICTED: uncharacterized protein DDB_G0286299-like [Polistes dominula]